MNLDTGISLVTLPEAKEYLKVVGSEEDTIIQTILNGVSSWVGTFLGRDLVRAERTEYYDGDGTDSLILRHRPIVSVATLNVDSTRTFASGYDVNVSANIIIQKNQGVLRAWNLFSAFSCGTANVKVKYTAGYLTAIDKTEADGGMPSGIRLAVKRIVDHQYRVGYVNRKFDVRSESIGDRNTTFAGPDIPEDAKAMLLPYRNWFPAPRFSHAD